METIHERKSEAGKGPHRLRELSDHHDNEGTMGMTNTTDARIRSMQLENLIPTRKEGRKATRSYKKSGRPTHSR